MRKLIFIFIIALLMIAGCISKPSINTINSTLPNPQKEVYEAKIVDGYQIAPLSWGVFNYKPEVIKLKVNVPTKIIADTDRLTGCFRALVIPDLGISKNVNPANNVIEFTPTKTGTFNFACSMGMGGGTLIVEP